MGFLRRIRLFASRIVVVGILTLVAYIWFHSVSA